MNFGKVKVVGSQVGTILRPMIPLSKLTQSKSGSTLMRTKTAHSLTQSNKVTLQKRRNIFSIIDFYKNKKALGKKFE